MLHEGACRAQPGEVSSISAREHPRRAAHRGARPHATIFVCCTARSGRAGISKYVMRERLAALLPLDGRLIVSTMRFPENLVAVPAAPARTKIATCELDLATQLIEGMPTIRPMAGDCSS